MAARRALPILRWLPPLALQAQQRSSRFSITQRLPPPTTNVPRHDALPQFRVAAVQQRSSRRLISKRPPPPPRRSEVRRALLPLREAAAAGRVGPAARHVLPRLEEVAAAECQVPQCDARFSLSVRPPPLAVWVQKRDIFSPDSKRPPPPKRRSRSATRASPPPGGRRR